MLWRRWGVFRFDMVMISFVSKDNEGNQNLLVEDRQVTFLEIAHTNVGASPLPHWNFVAGEILDNSGFLDFDRALPTVDVALTGAGYGQLGLIHILVDGRTCCCV